MPDCSAADWISPMWGGELAAGGERDATPGGRRLWVKRWSKRETERETQTMGGGQGRAGAEAWKPRRRGGRGVGSCHPMG
jgi:hypothetical protein